MNGPPPEFHDLPDPRRERRDTCTSKIPYRKKREAQARVDRIKAEGRDPRGTYHAYHCRFCGNYHTGNYWASPQEAPAGNDLTNAGA